MAQKRDLTCVRLSIEKGFNLEAFVGVGEIWKVDNHNMVWLEAWPRDDGSTNLIVDQGARGGGVCAVLCFIIYIIIYAKNLNPYL